MAVLTRDSMAVQFANFLDKDIKEAKAYRITTDMFQRGDNRIIFDIEVDFNNGHVTYTVVGKAALMDDLTVRFNRVTRKTRLHVPIRELQAGMKVYSADGHGPYILDYPFTNVYPATSSGGVTFFNKEDFVGVEFYYASGDGIVCGDRLIVSEEELVPLLDSAHYTLDDFVNGCKFDMFALMYTVSTNGNHSVFTNQKVKNVGEYLQ